MITAKIIKRTDSLTELPLISRLPAEPPPKGKPISKAIIKFSDGFVTIRYETGDARPQGEAGL